MKIRTVPVVVILCLVLVNACSANATHTEETALDSIYTAAASTLFSKELVTTPTSTATMFVTTTPFSLPTDVPATVANQGAASSSSSASTVNGCNSLMPSAGSMTGLIFYFKDSYNIA